MTVTATRRSKSKRSAPAPKPVPVVLISEDDYGRGIPILMELDTVKEEAARMYSPSQTTSVQRIAELVVAREMRTPKFAAYITGVAGNDRSAQQQVVARLLGDCLVRLDKLRVTDDEVGAHFRQEFMQGSCENIRSFYSAHG